MNRGRVKRVAIITVDAEKAHDAVLDRTERVPALPQVLSTIANAPMANYSFDTLELVRQSIENWNKDQATATGNLAPVTFYRINVAFSSLPDGERKYFDALPTNFSLTSAEVDALLAVGPKLLRSSRDFQRLVNDLAR